MSILWMMEREKRRVLDELPRESIKLGIFYRMGI